MAYPCVIRKSDGLVLARARTPEQVLALEGNWYFHPDCINHDALKISERTYLCPYKGTCWWVDVKVGGGFLPDVAWTYPEPYPGFRRIAGWYGFYPSAHDFVKAECE